jgi:hypothetical protein
MQCVLANIVNTWIWYGEVNPLVACCMVCVHMVHME